MRCSHIRGPPAMENGKDYCSKRLVRWKRLGEMSLVDRKKGKELSGCIGLFLDVDGGEWV